jgi:hypothetical protein
MTVEWPAPIEVVQRLIEVSEERGEALGDSIVFLGGSALAAHGLRTGSNDVDVYTPSVGDASIAQVETEFRARFGRRFRLDVTTVANIWGIIMIPDLADAPLVTMLEAPSGRPHFIRALRLEDVYILKAASGRERDPDDLPLVAPKTTWEAIVKRFDQLLPGVANRGAIPAIADALVTYLARDYRVAAERVIAALAVGDELKQDLREAHREP